MAPTTLRASFWPPWPSIRLGPGHVYGSLFNAFCESEISGRGTASEGSKSLPGIEEVAPLACPTLISRLRLRKLLIALECVDTNKRQATQSLEVIAAAAEMRGCGADSNGGGASPKTEEGSFLAVVSNIQFQIWALRLKETKCIMHYSMADASVLECRSWVCRTEGDPATSYGAGPTSCCDGLQTTLRDRLTGLDPHLKRPTPVHHDPAPAQTLAIDVLSSAGWPPAFPRFNILRWIVTWTARMQQ